MTFDELEKLIRVEKLYKGIYHFKFPTQKEAARTMLRFQEYYESPEFKGKIFSLKEFKEWYSTWRLKPSRGTGFSYYSDWSGFNVPDYVIRSVEDSFKNLTQREKLILHYCSFINDEKFYIIATSDEKNHDELEHEKAHALFYIDDNYRNEVLKFLDSAPKEIYLVHRYLHTIGYSKSVFDDETNAFLCHDPDYIMERGVNLVCLQDLIVDLQQLYCKTISASL